MVDWQVTATTIYCDAVDEDVTLLVYKDKSTRCTGYGKYVASTSKDAAKELKKKAKNLGHSLKCEGPECPRVTKFRDEIFIEEINAKN